ncbi:MAG: UDP-N-acetylglucosamine 2-epimerase (non-hydrolyzing) [Saprospiraceae bacterium]|nr:UDP-N-acetylglucosamine 2-epimerase (non-hydrolyzing) [Saprospiraceae bacterium]
MKIIQVVGARPNFMKVAPLHRALCKSPQCTPLIVHTGQHFDEQMSAIFFDQLELPKPDFYLGVGSGSPTQVSARIMLAFEDILMQEKPDLVVVVGDVTSTFATALTSVRQNIKIAHVEAGLRSNDRTMPEEINRILTDQISDLLFTTEASAMDNLRSENIPESKIHFVGNCMIDSLIHFLPKANSEKIGKELEISNHPYIVMTMHRPSNVDTKEGLQKLVNMIRQLTKFIQVVFPVHPRTRSNLELFNFWDQLTAIKQLHMTKALGYIEFLGLMKGSTAILTDSGGVQEESTFLKIPCLTFRKTTERPITVELGSNILIHELDVNTTIRHLKNILNGDIKQSIIPDLWDGFAGDRIARILLSTESESH